MRSCINISIKKDLMVIKVREESELKEVLDSLKKKLPELKKLYKDDETPILVMGKVLKNREMDDIKKVIKKYLDVKIEFETPRMLGLHGIKKTFKKDIATSETKFVRNSLRSGQKEEFEGSIVVLGDVNGGAEVIAGENIVVLGVLRGLAHAGAKGNREAIISAALIESPQIRIANVVKEREKDEIYDCVAKNIAFLNDDDVIEIS